MNYTKRKLREMKKEYNGIAWRLVKKDKRVPKEVNIILNLIEDIEELEEAKLMVSA